MVPRQPRGLVSLRVRKAVIRPVVNLAGERVARRRVWKRKIRVGKLVCDFPIGPERCADTVVAVGDNRTVRFKTVNEERGTSLPRSSFVI